MKFTAPKVSPFVWLVAAIVIPVAVVVGVNIRQVANLSIKLDNTNAKVDQLINPPSVVVTKVEAAVASPSATPKAKKVKVVASPTPVASEGN